MSNNTSWQSVQGTLLHRTTLHPGGKWLNLWPEGSYPGKRESLRAAYVEECVQFARDLREDLRDEFFDDARYLADPGGPHWSKVIDDYEALSHPDRKLVLKAFVPITRAASQALMEQAKRDQWTWILTEVIDPVAQLLSLPNPNSRMDVVAQRRDQETPLVVDLKTGRHTDCRKAANKELASVYCYAQVLADTLSASVDYQVLYVNRWKKTGWSKVRTCRAQ